MKVAVDGTRASLDLSEVGLEIETRPLLGKSKRYTVPLSGVELILWKPPSLVVNNDGKLSTITLEGTDVQLLSSLSQRTGRGIGYSAGLGASWSPADTMTVEGSCLRLTKRDKRSATRVADVEYATIIALTVYPPAITLDNGTYVAFNTNAYSPAEVEVVLTHVRAAMLGAGCEREMQASAPGFMTWVFMGGVIANPQIPGSILGAFGVPLGPLGIGALFLYLGYQRFKKACLESAARIDREARAQVSASA